jgi:hypothetical protein
MAIFDKIVKKKENFKGYIGNPPINEAEYNSRKDEMFSANAPTWTEIQTEMNNYIDPKASSYQKLLDLGLTQDEATALTDYTPPKE